MAQVLTSAGAISLGNTTTNVSTNSTSISIGDKIHIDRLLGTNIGDMTAGGGLAAAFDGNQGSNSLNSATKTNANSAYVGKTLATSSTISKALVYPSTDGGFGSARACTLLLFGKVGSVPANATNGTELAELEVTNAATIDPILLTSNNLISMWDHTWVAVYPSSNSGSLYVAEVEFYSVDQRALTISAGGMGVGNTSISSNGISTPVLNIGSSSIASGGITTQALITNTISTNTISTNTINANGSIGTSGQRLISNGSGTYWANGNAFATNQDVLAATNSTLMVSPLSLANLSAAANGYVILPGGIIIQWGWVSANSSTGGAITFPIAFPSAIFSYSTTSNNATDIASVATTPNTTTMNVKTTGTTQRNCHYIVIGN